MGETTDKVTGTAKKSVKGASKAKVFEYTEPQAMVEERHLRDLESKEASEENAAIQEAREEVSDPVEEARARIAETRAEMSETIEEIKEKVSPKHLVQEAKESLHRATIGKAEHALHAVGDTAHIVGSEVSNTAQEIAGDTRRAAHDIVSILRDTARRNPLLVAALGIGICSLWVCLRNWYAMRSD